MRRNRFLLGIVFVALVTSCGTLKTVRGSWAQKSVKAPEWEMKGYGPQLASKFGLMSLFAETVYRRTYDREMPSTISTCGKEESEDVNFLMPWVVQGGEKFTWNRLLVSEVTEVEPCYSGGGLFYETYVLRDEDETILEAVIAYRGTDGPIEDMKTNLAAAFGREPPQYKDAKVRLQPLVEYLTKASPMINIYAVGHSLGGGLAQQAGYLSSDIAEVFAFNSSPITNWSSLALAKKEEIGIKEHYPVIYRVNHGGEGLGIVRYISSLFTSSRFNRYDVDFQLTEKKAVSGHAMKLISCRLAEEVAAFG